MIKAHKKGLKALGIALLVSVLLIGCGNKTGDVSVKVASRDFFTIGKSACPVSIVKLVAAENLKNNAESYGIDLTSHPNLKVKKRYEQYIENMTIDELTAVYAKALLAKSLDINLTEDEEELMEWAAEDYFGSLDEKEVELTDITVNELEQYYKNYALSEKLYNNLIANVNYEVSDDEARVMHVEKLVTSDKNRAISALKEIKDGDAFASVAANYSEDGDVSITLTRGVLPEEIEDVVFSLNDNGTTEILESDGKYYVFYCIDKYDEELTEEHKKDIRAQREYNAFTLVYDKFLESTPSAINEEEYAKFDVSDLHDFKTSALLEIYKKYNK